MSFKDPHEVLGVSPGAGSDDVKKAYRKLAARLHPDKPDGDAEKFREVTEAFNSIQGMVELPNEEPAFIDEDVVAILELSLEEMAFGCHKSVSAKIGAVKCGACSGAGFATGSPMVPCMSCLGTGKAPGIFGFNNSVRSCSTCKGIGTIPMHICKTCSGKGRMKGEARVGVRIPAGVESGQELSFSGNLGKLRGRLFVRIVGTPHSRFEREGDDLILSHKLNVFEAMRGCVTSVIGLNGGNVDVDVPAGVQPGDFVVMQGCGIRNARTGTTGDLRVRVQVEIPKKMTPRAIRLVEELADEFIRK